MKKLALTAAIAAATAMSTGAHAVNVYADLTIGGPTWFDIELNCATVSTTPIATTGLTLTGSSLSGTLCLDPNSSGWGNTPVGGPFVKLDFSLTNSAPANASTGTLYDGGLVDISVDSGGAWTYLYSVSTAVTNIPCLGVKPSGVPGPFSPSPLGSPACTAALLGMPFEIYLFR